jgi:hypothetical protein
MLFCERHSAQCSSEEFDLSREYGSLHASNPLLIITKTSLILKAIILNRICKNGNMGVKHKILPLKLTPKIKCI